MNGEQSLACWVDHKHSYDLFSRSRWQDIICVEQSSPVAELLLVIFLLQPVAGDVGATDQAMIERWVLVTKSFVMKSLASIQRTAFVVSEEIACGWYFLSVKIYLFICLFLRLVYQLSFSFLMFATTRMNFVFRSPKIETWYWWWDNPNAAKIKNIWSMWTSFRDYYLVTFSDRQQVDEERFLPYWKTWRELKSLKQLMRPSWSSALSIKTGRFKPRNISRDFVQMKTLLLIMLCWIASKRLIACSQWMPFLVDSSSLLHTCNIFLFFVEVLI